MNQPFGIEPSSHLVVLTMFQVVSLCLATYSLRQKLCFPIIPYAFYKGIHYAHVSFGLQG
jgi:hypothetical protein